MTYTRTKYLLYRSFSFLNFFSSSGKPFDRPYNFEKDKKWINGLNEYELKINEHLPLCQSNVFRHVSIKDGNITQLDIDNLRPGSIVAVR